MAYKLSMQMQMPSGPLFILHNILPKYKFGHDQFN
jgi:hypothetical protein